MLSHSQILQLRTVYWCHKMLFFSCLVIHYERNTNGPHHHQNSLTSKTKKIAIQATFVTSHPNGNDRKLRTSARLGLWTDKSVYQKWTTFFSQEEDHIYKRAGLRWLIYTSAGGRNMRSRKYNKSTVSTQLLTPSANQLASIYPRHSRHAIECSTSWEFSEVDEDPLLFDPTAGPFSTVQDALKVSVDSRRVLLDHFVLPKDNCQLIATAIIQGTVIVVCDGSYDPRDHLDTAAFVIVVNKKEKKPLTAANWSPGTLSNQSAYRSKLTGVKSILSVLAILVKHYKITSGEITIDLDCDTALKTCPSNLPLNIQQASFDLLQDIKNRIKMLPIVIECRWVEGHQKEKGKKMDW